MDNVVKRKGSTKLIVFGFPFSFMILRRGLTKSKSGLFPEEATMLKNQQNSGCLRENEKKIKIYTECVCIYIYMYISQ